METEIVGTATESVCSPIADLFARQREKAAQSVFANKALLDPSLFTPEIIGRSEQYETLVRYLADVDQGYLPPLIQVYGPTGSGKTTVVQQVTAHAGQEFPQIRVVYVNLKQCHSLYAVANRILSNVTGSSEPPVSGLDGVFEQLWAATRDRPYLLSVLDEVDAAFGHGPVQPVGLRIPARPAPQQRGSSSRRPDHDHEPAPGLGVRLDSRVKSSTGSHSVFFAPYDRQTLLDILQGA